MLSRITNVETPEYDVSNTILLWFTSEVARGGGTAVDAGVGMGYIISIISCAPATDKVTWPPKHIFWFCHFRCIKIVDINSRQILTAKQHIAHIGDIVRHKTAQIKAC